MARAEVLAARGIGFVDCGVSGGVWGRDAGYALMVGGADDAVTLVAPLLTALAPPSGFAHVGPAGAGHFAKMVHNAVEYGMMQAFAEGYALLDAAPLPVDVDATLRSWQEGSVVRSWLLDLLVRALEERPGLDGVPAVASDSGEGRWAVAEAVAAGVPVPVTTAALFARFASQRPDDPALQAIAALRHQFGGHRF
jgi:6-phosphogluconate dehydrogenase